MSAAGARKTKYIAVSLRSSLCFDEIDVACFTSVASLQHLVSARKLAISQNGIIEGFSPSFSSIAKDCDRYSDGLCRLIDTQEIRTEDYIELSGTGSLWVVLQYIEAGHLDLVEAHVRGHVISRDFYGPIFENTQAIFERLVECSEHERVFSLYRAAISHRLKALKDETINSNKATPESHAWRASKEWVVHYMPTTQKMIEDFKALLAETRCADPAVQVFEQSIHEINVLKRDP